MTIITDARAREFWCAVFLQSMSNNPAKIHDARIADAAEGGRVIDRELQQQIAFVVFMYFTGWFTGFLWGVILL